MKTLTKLALVSAMAISANAMAAQLQSLDDEAMSATTGQDGISIVIAGDIEAQMIVHDKDGYQASDITGPAASTIGSLPGTAGAIVMGNGTTGDKFSIADTGATKKGITLHIDADANAGAPVLNVNVALPDELTITTGSIYVATSGGIDAASAAQYTGTLGTSAAPKILDNITVKLGGAKVNVQLGNAPQGSFITLSGNIGDATSVVKGLQLDNFSIVAPTLTTAQWTALALPTSLTQNAAVLDRGIHMSKINIRTAGNANSLVLDGTKINVADQGLVISGTQNVDVRIGDLKLGSKANTQALGDIALLNLKVPTLVVRGH